MATNFKFFKVEVEKGPNGKKVSQHVVRFHKAIHFEAQKRLIKRTPRDTGLTKQHWQSTIGAPATGDVKGTRGAGVMTGLPAYAVSWITNNRPHILVLEDGGFKPADPGPSKDKRKGRKGRILVKGGYSVQAPAGMAAVTVAEMQSLIQQ